MDDSPLEEMMKGWIDLGTKNRSIIVVTSSKSIVCENLFRDDYSIDLCLKMFVFDNR